MALDNPTEEQHHVSSENKDPEIWCKNKRKKILQDSAIFVYANKPRENIPAELH